MKRLTGTVLTALLSMTMLGCSNNNPTVSSTTHSGSADVDSTTTENINQPADNVDGVSSSDADLPNTYKVPQHYIYVDAPAYQEIEKATKIWKTPGSLEETTIKNSCLEKLQTQIKVDVSIKPVHVPSFSI